MKFITIKNVFEEKNNELIHNKNTRKHKKEKFDFRKYFEKKINWRLSIFECEIPPTMDFSYYMPAEKLTEEITSDFIISELNFKNIFDFEYFPNEGDYFNIYYKYTQKELKNKFRTPLYSDFMCFIYTNGKWNNDFYRGEVIAKEIFEGFVEE